ncbi:AlpA family phage regulatory protein [Burkholderia cenocepacia]|uniref:helix-turn-helix transcriptional regulator n=1 Tax=Burkholderia lata (strain ATCC 17760 / DSM 23089 / LMG 22485 / NCIMB 9086 / R18194 / 383) TaxID=482957 RepID=UPI000F5B445C|nr:AlpA family phage regulatory protein [Burkholderia cenocepacia]
MTANVKLPKLTPTAHGSASSISSTPSIPIDPILRRPAVREMLGISNSTLHAWVKSGRLEPPLVLGPRVRGWRLSVIEAYIASCANTQAGTK